jgi:hypothetical protein
VFTQRTTSVFVFVHAFGLPFISVYAMIPGIRKVLNTLDPCPTAQKYSKLSV